MVKLSGKHDNNLYEHLYYAFLYDFELYGFDVAGVADAEDCPELQCMDTEVEVVSRYPFEGAFIS